MSGFDGPRIERLRDVMAGHVAQNTVGGLAWLVSCDGDLAFGVAGHLTRGESAPVRRDSIFRIASMSKPIAAVAALILVEECKVRLDDPVDALLPELADRKVLVDGRGAIDGATVPAHRPITLHDLLTFRLGWGMDFGAGWPQPMLTRMGELGLGDGPPNPQTPPEPDEWIKRLGTLPLQYQPGERWLYNVGSDVLGVLIARAAEQPLDAFLRERVFEPLGMSDTGFWTSETGRLGTTYGLNPQTGERIVYDPPNGQWASAPAFPSAAGGLVSTIDDFHSFGRMLLSGGYFPDGSRMLSRASVAAMTTDQIGAGPGVAGPSLDGAQGWGFGVAVQMRRTGLGPSVGGYGWAGGLGSSWGNDPTENVIGVVLTTDMFTSAFPPPAAIQDFWSGLYAALG
jgi:CubicO group peptidase (beta-lactamase class C family)